MRCALFNMATKKKFSIYVGSDKVLSAAVQRVMFSLGYPWRAFTHFEVKFTNYERIMVNYNHGEMALSTGGEIPSIEFDAATELGKIIAFVNAPEEKVYELKTTTGKTVKVQKITKYDVEFDTFGGYSKAFLEETYSFLSSHCNHNLVSTEGLIFTKKILAEIFDDPRFKQ